MVMTKIELCKKNFTLTSGGLFVNRVLSGFLWGVCECGHPYFYA